MTFTNKQIRKYVKLASSFTAVALIIGIGLSAFEPKETSVAAISDTPQSFYTSAITTPQSVVRDSYTITDPPPPPPAPEPEVAAVVSEAPHAIADPGTSQAIAYDMLMARGLGQGEFDCLVSLWNRESGWNANAYNPSSGAGGIPQALPASKMSSAGEDWATNPATQISWGIGYIESRYGTPCGAWSTSENQGWY